MALDTHRETASWRRLAAKLLDQAVVSAACADGALGAELVGDPLENGQIVVIQSAHQSRVDAIGNAGLLEQRLHAAEMLEGGLAKEIDQLRRTLDEFLHVRILAVENAQRV